VAGLIFLTLSLVGFRSKVLNAIPDSLKSGIAAGIGLFIAVVGMKFGNLVTSGGALTTFTGLQGNPVAWLTLLGVGVTVSLMALRVRGAILLGILATTAVGLGMGLVAWPSAGLTDIPHGIEHTAGGFAPGFVGVGKAIFSTHVIDVLAFVFILFFMDLFDTVGTLVGVAQRGDLMVDGRLPRAERALAADAAGTVIGAGLGTSTVTSYIESITGVAAGARTGLAAVVTGALLLAAMFFQPIVEMIGGGVKMY
jgi:AGZA family xanthine/uracil permease-like MFS transporter